MIARVLLPAIAFAALLSPALAAAPHRLPSDYKWGRCLLVVDGQTRISGKCSYQIEAGGDFNIQGPHQVFAGIDFPDMHSGAGDRSNDFWADVYKEDGAWTAYANSDIHDTHADGPDWENLRRDGACYSGDGIKVCLWR